MCITSTARRRSLTLQVLPSHLLTTTSSTGAASEVVSSTEAATAAETLPASFFSMPKALPLHPRLPTKSSKKKKKSSSQLPHHDGLVVQHHYHDHAFDPVVDPTLIKHKAKGGVIVPFPVKLHDMLDKIEADGLAHVVSWQPHGRCFVVHKPKEFVNHVMPHYFKQTKMASFQRQLNLYGFNRLTGGLDKGGYYHEMFLKGKVSLAYDIHRMRVKGTGVRLPTNPDNEPNFYTHQPMTTQHMDANMTASMVPAPAVTSSAAMSAMPPLPAPKFDTLAYNLEQRRADLLKQSHDHSRKIAEANKQHQSQQQAESDVVFFEGLPFHYLDPSALPSKPSSAKRPAPTQQQPSKRAAMPHRPVLAHSGSTVVSESDSDNESSNGDGNALLPSFSPSSMDWDGPLSNPTLQAHMRRSSFQSFAKVGETRPLEEDIEGFFQGFDMPVDLYHDQIEQMGDDDDTAFGYLLEQAITE